VFGKLVRRKTSFFLFSFGSDEQKTQKKKVPSNFHEFWGEEVHYKNYPKKNFDV
jgi:hypothetical protein